MVCPHLVGPWLEIDLSAIRQNYADACRATPARVAAVVKSDAYGLGLETISLSLAEAGCKSFFVANIEEGLALRKVLPTATIIVFATAANEDKRLYAARNLIPACNSFRDVVDWTAISSCSPLVINAETGFHRAGLAIEDVRRLRQTSARRPDLVMSHLSRADMSDARENDLQYRRFLGHLALLQPWRSSLVASAGLGLPHRYHFDLARVGSLLFGLAPFPAGLSMLPVAFLRTRIVDIRKVPVGESIGYAATFRTERASIIAIIGLGYAHGLPWACANNLSVYIGRHSAPIIGRVAMEYVAIDVTDIPADDAQQGSVVEIIGPRQSVADLARSAKTIPQEVLVRLGGSSHRIYRDQG